MACQIRSTPASVSSVGTPGALVGPHDVGDRSADLVAPSQQVGCGVDRIRQIDCAVALACWPSRTMKPPPMEYHVALAGRAAQWPLR